MELFCLDRFTIKLIILSKYPSHENEENIDKWHSKNYNNNNNNTENIPEMVDLYLMCKETNYSRCCIGLNNKVFKPLVVFKTFNIFYAWHTQVRHKGTWANKSLEQAEHEAT